MICLNFTAFVLMLFATYADNHVVGTTNARPGSNAAPYRPAHQVAIVGKRNGSDASFLICSGGIVTESLILTAAECFVDDDGQLIDYSFWIVADKLNWRLPGGIRIAVDLIYLTGDGNYFLNNIALAELTENLGIAYSRHLNSLDVPNRGESFLKDQGILSGYGYKWVVTMTDVLVGQWQRVMRGTNDLLKRLDVLVVDNSLCRARYGDIDDNKQLCGLILPGQVGHSWNICKNGAGSPLVIGNKIVGVATQVREDCDDSIYGTVYTNVSAFAPFVNSIVDGNPLSGTLVYRNRIQMNTMVAAAA